MFAGFLGERRGDVQQNGFTQNTSMVLTRDSGLTWDTTLANPFINGISEPKGKPACLRERVERVAMEESERRVRTRSAWVGSGGCAVAGAVEAC